MSSLWCSAGSEMEFSTKTLIVCCGEGKMCLHAWILGFKRKCCLQKCMTFLPHSRFHTLALAHTSLLSAHCMMGGESGKSDGGSSHWRAYSSWVIGSSWGGLSSVVNSRRCRGDKDGLNKGGDFLHNAKRAETSLTVSYIFNHSLANTSSTKLPTETLLQIQWAAEEAGDMKTGTAVRD